MKTELLPLSSRQLAEAHYKLSIALDLTAGRLADAIHHAQRALESIEARLVELQAGLAGTLPPLPEPSDNTNGKGKGKGKQVVLAQEELVQNWSKAQIEAEIKELVELKQDLALKVCDSLSLLRKHPSPLPIHDMAANSPWLCFRWTS